MNTELEEFFELRPVEKQYPLTKYQKAKQFVEKYYPLTSEQEHEPKEFNRIIWYCNLSETLIRELNDVQVEPKDEKSTADFIYKEGYDHYRIYECGHLVLDTYLILSLFDNLNYNWSPKWTLDQVEKLLEQSKTKCPCCAGLSDNMYIISNSLCVGTVIVGDIIPKRYLKFLTSLYKKGDVVDCEGYRGTGLYMFDGIEFKQIRTESYYPMIPLEYNKLRGYTYYWKIVDACDLLLFENNIAFTPGGGEFYSFDCNKIKLIDDDDQEDDDDGENYDQDDDDDDQEETDDDDDVTDNKLKEIPYPFTDVKLLNRCLKSKKLYKAKLNDYETMVFGNGYCAIYHINGDEIDCNFIGMPNITGYHNLFDEQQQKLQLFNTISSFPTYVTSPCTQEFDHKEWNRLFEYSCLYQYKHNRNGKEKLLQLLGRQFDIPFPTLLRLKKRLNWDKCDGLLKITDYASGQFRDDLELLVQSDKLTPTEIEKINYALTNYL